MSRTTVVILESLERWTNIVGADESTNEGAALEDDDDTKEEKEEETFPVAIAMAGVNGKDETEELTVAADGKEAVMGAENDATIDKAEEAEEKAFAVTAEDEEKGVVANAEDEEDDADKGVVATAEDDEDDAVEEEAYE